jgi:hypothetical protein
VNAAALLQAAEVLAPVIVKIPDAVEKLAAWAKGGPAPVDVLDALPETPDLTRGDLELEAMKRRAESGSGG